MVYFCDRLSFHTDRQTKLVENPLQPLALGDIRPNGGWLAEQLDLVADGITGRLPEYGPYFKKDRNGFMYPETKKGWEEIPYWLRGFYPLAVLTGNKKQLALATEYIEAVFKSADTDGFFGPAYLKSAELTEGGAPIPDLYPNMILIDTLILYYTHTKDERVISLLDRYFAFCLSLSDEQFLPARDTKLRWQKIRAGGMLEQLYWFYQIKKDDSALLLAERVYRAIAKSTSGFIATHAVDFSQRFAYDAIYSQQSHSPDDFASSEYEYNKFALVYGQMPRGIFAADEQIRIGATDPREAFEPCGMVELTKNFYTLGRISALTKYGDLAEDIMLNHFTASFTPDYRQIQYLTSANCPILSNDLYAATYNGSESHDRSYQIMTPNNRCCGHNTGMGWPWYMMNLWQKSADGGLAAFLYASCKIDTTADGKRIALEVNTDYPFRDTVNITIRSNGSFPLYFRVPAWCKKCHLVCNTEELFCDEIKGGWLTIKREWHKNDKLQLRFEMALSLTKWPSNKSVSVDLGPLTYSVRIKEEYKVVDDALAYNHPEPHLWNNYEILPSSPWNYGLPAQKDVNDFIRISKCRDELPKQPFDESAAPIVLRAKARKIPEWKIQDSCAAELQKGPFFTDTPEEEIELIPLGCARLRISCFPIVTDDPNAKRWEEQSSRIPLEERPPFYTSHYDFKDASKDPGPWEP